MKFHQVIVCAMLVGAAALAQALEVKPYSPAALAEAQKADMPVALHFRADWCPTCRAQDKVLEGLKSEPGLGVTVLSVNYDTEKDLKKQYKISTQSTLVVMHGPKESARVVGDTSANGIRTALKSAL